MVQQNVNNVQAVGSRHRRNTHHRDATNVPLGIVWKIAIANHVLLGTQGNMAFATNVGIKMKWVRLRVKFAQLDITLTRTMFAPCVHRVSLTTK